VGVTERMVDTSYEPFSQEPEYVELNRAFIRAVVPHLTQCQHVLDMACGTGLLAQLLMTELAPRRNGVGRADPRVPVAVVGVDVSRESLKLAQRQIAALPWRAPVALVECSAADTPARSESVDAGLMGNAIHCFDDKDALLGEIRRVLEPGGLFAFNSSFYAGTIVPGTEPFYHQWMKAALEHVRSKDAELRAAGQPGVVRTRGRGTPAFSHHWLSPAEYRALFERNGFAVRYVNERIYSMSQRNFETVGSYAGLASVLLGGYPPDLAAEALEAAVAPAFRALQLEKVERGSLELVAVKV
jgi:ubiquinone/menaquinone biosynthesis C-methylase UbiE